MADIFISYASEDRERAHALADALAANGFSVWWDRQILPGETFESVIERELAAADCVLVLWSASSVQSHWARAEAEEALQRGVLVPALIDDVRIPIAFRHVQAASLIDWTPAATDHQGFDMLLRAIERLDVPDLPAAAPPAQTEPHEATPQIPRRATAAAVPAEPQTAGVPQREAKSGGFSRRRGLAFAGVGLVAAVVLITQLGGGGGLDDGYVPDDAAGGAALDEAQDDAGDELVSREPEALDAGYEPVIAWDEEAVNATEALVVYLDAVDGVLYHAWARTTPDCDVDIYITDEIGDFEPSSDATLSFSVEETHQLRVEFQVHSTTQATCTVGRGIYRDRSSAAAS